MLFRDKSKHKNDFKKTQSFELEDNPINQDILYVTSFLTEERQVNKKIMGIELRPNISYLSGLSIFIVTITGNMMVSFLSQSTNILLKNKFNITDEQEMIQISSLMVLYCNVAMIFVCPFVGVLFDILGRKVVISFFFIIAGPLCALLPYTKSLWFGFTLSRIGLAILTGSMISNTLIPDYVERKCIGKSVIYNNFARYLGNFLSPIIFLTIIIYYSITYSYNLMGIVMTLTGVILYFTIQEPTDLVHDQDAVTPNTNHQLLNGILMKFRIAIQECKQNRTLIFSFAQTFVVRMGIILGSNAYSLWILLKIPDEVRAFEMLAFSHSFSSCLNFIIQIPLIKILDKIQPRLLVIFAQSLRATVLFFSLWTNQQGEQWIVANIILMSLSNGIANVSRDLVFQKNQASQSRGVIHGFMELFTNLGMLTFIFIFACLSPVIGLCGCFCFLGTLDLLLLLLSLQFKFTKPEN
ncbi:major facilitator superfamily mfs_1 [Stylonychia lemnae]|uniref:Major facilitator superfamily mfs_1 n=1 Tax=Stylonychia lemnae TaxID=5949 RepID=A0A078A8S1_STYLE|nr:major facilitator superfamily mfs_1 [Stylonychia lemnae]|eukprot:CDW78624.1 major facilitator superfamily mfs_1 [Stylonychia lemnae]